MTAGRRALGALTLGVAGAAAAAPAGVRFTILRQGGRIGTHSVVFTEAGGRLTTRIDVAITVRLAGITVFRMTHGFEEVTEAGRFVACTSRQERNGTVTPMRARAEPGGVVVETGGQTRRLPAGAAPLTWWDPGRFTGPLFDNVTGAPLQLRWTRTPLAGGAVRWRCEGEEQSEASYAEDGTWLDWKTRAEDGSTVTYERA